MKSRSLKNQKQERLFPIGLGIAPRVGPYSRFVSRSGQCTNPRHQGCQVRPVFLPHGPELESDARARNRVSYDRIGTDLSLPNEKA